MSDTEVVFNSKISMMGNNSPILRSKKGYWSLPGDHRMKKGISIAPGLTEEEKSKMISLGLLTEVSSIKARKEITRQDVNKGE